jgi:hypothetical protein
VHAGDLDRLIGLDVAREGADLRLQTAARRVELRHHGERALVVQGHRVHEEAVEAAPVGAGKPVELVRGQHPGHQRVARAVTVALLAPRDAPLSQPAPDRVQLGPLREPLVD